jgi:hypothetical protein
MLEEVLRQCRLRTKCEADWDDDYIGFWCESKKYWSGLYFEEPHLLCLETTERFRMAEDARERNDAGGEFEYWEDDEVDIWRNRLDLSSDGGKFFGLPASEQMQEMKRFIQASLAAAKKLEVASEDEAGKQGS